MFFILFFANQFKEMKTTVALKKVQFYAKHGYYEEEKKIGNQFEVNLSCIFKQEEGRFVNYEHLFSTVQGIMDSDEPVDFIETLVEQIIKKIRVEYDFLSRINCEIIKLTPPIAKFEGKGTSVSMQWKK